MPNELSDVLAQLAAEKVVKDAAHAVDAAQLRAQFDTSAARAFFTQLAIHLAVKPDPSIETACVDGKTIRYNPAFIASLTANEVHGVIIGHEPAHCSLQHITRGMGFDCDECRAISSDLEVNALCQEAGFTLPAGCVLPGVGLFKDFPPEDSFEIHYAKLHARHKGGKKGKKPGDEQGDGDDDNDNGLPRIFKPGKDANGKPTKPRPGDIFLPGDFMPAKDDAQAQQIEAEWRGKIAAAAQEIDRKMAAGKLKGDLPGSLKAWISGVLHPKAHWRETLREFTVQTLRKKHENDWSRPSRRGLAAGLYLPRHRGEELGELVIAIDTSGSVSDELLVEFAKELQGVIDCEPCKAQIIYCDAAINHVDSWEPSDGPIEFRAVGRGGTDFRPVWKHIRENELDPACCIYLTDGEGCYGDEPPYPVLWALSQPYDVPWGKKIVIES